MYDYSSGRVSNLDDAALAGRQSVLGKVLSLLGFSFLFTAGGALIAQRLGPGAFWPALIGSFVTLFILMAAREKSPINLGLLYLFAVFEGMLLGLLVSSYIASGLGSAVIDAAATTAVVTLAAGMYGANTQRDLSGLGSILFIGLIAVVVASIVGIFLHMPALYLAISVVAALLFTGFIVFDLNRVARAREVTEGQAIMLAVSVYLDIVNLFVALLRIFGVLNSRDD